MRVHNFGAGPCTLPLDVLSEAQAEFTDFAGSGMSILELSHRSKHYEAVHNRTLELTREVAAAPPEFDILFIQGGATMQFGMVPLNLLSHGETAGYILSGTWGNRAFEDGSAVGDVYAAWDGADSGFSRMPTPDEIAVRPGSRYLHLTTNETIGGIRMVDWPDTEVPLVADMSSDYLSRPIEWGRYDLVYGGVQKNLAPAGMAVVFVRKSAKVSDEPLPSYLRYEWHAKSGSLGNTPPMFPIYLMGKVLERVAERGGLAAIEQEAAEKAKVLYDAIDESDGFYRNPVDERCRSHMNVVFRLPSEELEREFLQAAPERGLVGLKGHRSVGGCRASLYAALELNSVKELVQFMKGFKDSH